MVIPLPAGGPLDMEIPFPPTDFNIKMRPVVILLGLLQFVCVIGRIVIGDVIGGLCMLIVVWLAYQIAYGTPPLHLRWIFMWGFFCFLNAGFDFAIAAIRSE